MGIDCSRPSRSVGGTHVYISNTNTSGLRPCVPDRYGCGCRGGHHPGRQPRYWYIERGGDGNERFMDPFDYIDRYLMGGGCPLPWKHPKDWTTGDYDRLGEIMAEYVARMRGRGTAPWGGAAGMPWMPAGGAAGGGLMLPMMDGMWIPRARRCPLARGSLDDEMMDRVKKLEKIADDYTKKRDVLFGSEAEHMEEQYMRRMNKLWQDMLRDPAPNAMRDARVPGAPMGWGRGMTPMFASASGPRVEMPQRFVVGSNGAMATAGNTHPAQRMAMDPMSGREVDMGPIRMGRYGRRAPRNFDVAGEDFEEDGGRRWCRRLRYDDDGDFFGGRWGDGN